MRVRAKRLWKKIFQQKKIKEAAREIFLEKGDGLTGTRDIAERAGINLALLIIISGVNNYDLATFMMKIRFGNL